MEGGQTLINILSEEDRREAHMKLSFIVPCNNEQESLPLFRDAIDKVSSHPQLAGKDLEIIFVDDGSTDQTLELLEQLAREDWRVRYISFSRNFGKEAALYAGLQRARGDLVAVMDADLQDPPSLLPDMCRAVETEGVDVAAARRVDRKGEPLIRSFFARLFYRIINKMTDVGIVDGARDFRVMNRRYVDALLGLREYNRFSKGLFSWVGFKTRWFPYENTERVAGRTKWSFWSLFRYSIEGIVAFTTVPLVLSSCVGLLLCLLAFIAVVIIVVRKLLFGDPVDGWASLASLITFLGGCQMLFLGIIGQYMAKMYLEVKGRPVYIVAKESMAGAGRAAAEESMAGTGKAMAEERMARTGKAMAEESMMGTGCTVAEGQAISGGGDLPRVLDVSGDGDLHKEQSVSKDKVRPMV